MEAEADDERERKADLARRAGLADREPLAEVVQADADGDEKGQLPAGGEPLDPGARRELVDRRRTGTDEGGAAPLLHPAVVVDEAHQARDEPAREQSRVADELTPRPLALDGSLESLLHGPDAVREHVPEQEEENAARKGGEAGLHSNVDAPYTAEGQAEQDRESGDGAECESLCRRHAVGRPFVVDVRLTLQAGGA